LVKDGMMRRVERVRGGAQLVFGDEPLQGRHAT
jgi:hypothetical protein